MSNSNSSKRTKKLQASSTYGKAGAKGPLAAGMVCPICKGYGRVSEQLSHNVGFVFGFVYNFREKLKSIRGPYEVVEKIYTELLLVKEKKS